VRFRNGLSFAVVVPVLPFEGESLVSMNSKSAVVRRKAGRTFDASLMGILIVVSCENSIQTFMLVWSLVSPSRSLVGDWEFAQT
jgi:hypothetical protein